MTSLQGRTILITGAGSGLGRGLVDAFLSDGANVVALEWSADKLAALQRDIADDALAPVQGDVSRYKDNARAVETARTRFGGLDCFIQCAAICDFSLNFMDLDPDKLDVAFHDIFAVNVKGALYGAMAAVPALRERGGSIVFTLSTAGFMPGPHSIYTLSKHAAVGLVRQLAHELSPGVRVNAVVPGAIDGSELQGTEALGEKHLKPETAFPGMEDAVRQYTPMRMYPKPADYAGIYKLLADGAQSRAATGSIVFWDTGLSLVGAGPRTAFEAGGQPKEHG